MKLRTLTLSVCLFLLGYAAQAQNRKVTLLTPTDAQTLVPVLTTFTWDSLATDVDSFELQVSKFMDFQDTLLSAVVLGTETEYTLTNALDNDSTYYWRVISFDSLLFFVETSDIFSFTTIGLPPAKPTHVSPMSSTVGVSVNPTLTWSAVADADEYLVQVATFDNFSDTAFYAVVQSPATSVNVSTKLQSYKVYYWRVAGQNVNGIGEWSNFWNFTTLYTGLNTPKANFAMNVFPNPSQGAIVLNYDGNGSASRVTLLDAQGKEVRVVLEANLTSGPQTLEIDRNGLANGLYFVKVEQNGLAQTLKVVFE